MTLYFQEQFLKLKCTENAKITIKNASKSERKKKLLSLKKNITKGKKKCNELNRDIIEIQSRDNSIKKENIRKVLKRKFKICINTLDLFDLVLPNFFIFIFLTLFCFWRVFFSKFWKISKVTPKHREQRPKKKFSE